MAVQCETWLALPRFFTMNVLTNTETIQCQDQEWDDNDSVRQRGALYTAELPILLSGLTLLYPGLISSLC